MGVQFGALDATRMRVAFDGSLVPARIDMDDVPSFHFDGAALLFDEIRSLASLPSMRAVATVDHHEGELTIADALRVATVLSARLPRMQPSTARRAADVIAFIRAVYDAGATHVRWS